ncbi:MAG: class I mannose-6-phosphate isomerase [Bacteroidaceae bacterium]|nr:class I mannose-6-phosphate isomerase [Bacteroidaceae bacterium]
MRKTSYDKFPATHVEGNVITGWNAITAALNNLCPSDSTLVVDFYTGVYEEEVVEALTQGTQRPVILTRDLMKSEEEIAELTYRFITDDVLYGYVTPLRIHDFFDAQKLAEARATVRKQPKMLVVGIGAALVTEGDTPQAKGCEGLLVYADMARWEIQQRFRRHEVKALGIDNRAEGASLQYKRGYFNDWRVLDMYKDERFSRIDHWLDTNDRRTPKMITAEQFTQGLKATAERPFRVVPFFDPAPWGGQWMKEVCDLDREQQNYGWCFDCVPEENSLYLEVGGTLFELPSVDLVLLHSRALLGERVEARFGKDFPIRFDFLDTIGGGNLSLQVHPTAQFIREQFGMPYTQDESYYLLDAADDAVVYLGVKKDVDKDAMLADLRAAQRGELVFDAEKYVNKIPAKKHDHYLIPGGTIHCSGAGSMVLEISSTPSIFTFKLWDWQRLGLDGKPRPINVERGSHVIQWHRDTDYVYANLRNHVEPIAEGEGWSEERTGLHPNEFIEVRRWHFTVPITLQTKGSVNVLNLAEGEEAVVESPTGDFTPFTVHYAETFIVPAALGTYVIRPRDEKCIVLQAYVR